MLASALAVAGTMRWCIRTRAVYGRGRICRKTQIFVTAIRVTVVAVTKGRLDLGTWEQVFYWEFDGRRRKRVLVKIIGE